MILMQCRQIFWTLASIGIGFAREVQLTNAMEMLRMQSRMLDITRPGKRLNIDSSVGLLASVSAMGMTEQYL